MLKSNQIHVFCHLEDVKQIQKMRFFKIEAARRATSTKWKIVFFQNRGRPQGNIQKMGNREFSKLSFLTRALSLTR